MDAVVAERERLKKKKKRRKAWAWVISIIVVLVIALAAVSYFFFPVKQVATSDMEPTLSNGDVVLVMKNGPVERGGVYAVEADGKVVFDRVIALAGDTVNMDSKGAVYVNGEKLDEPYLRETSRGKVNISLPVKVGEGELFVMGDDRENSVDSRNSSFGLVDEDRVIGRVLIRFWPFNGIGFV